MNELFERLRRYLHAGIDKQGAKAYGPEWMVKSEIRSIERQRYIQILESVLPQANRNVPW